MSERRTITRGLITGMGLAALGLLPSAGCGSDVTGPGGGAGGTGGKGGATFTEISRLVNGGVDKVDLLLMVDNSRSMADKQAILATTVPDLIQGLVNPACVDDQGKPGAQPAGPLDACPAGTRRKFPPILDIHIGVVTSSIGGHASDACPTAETFSCPGGATNTTNDDAGHLVSRLDPCLGGGAQTYQGKGFLAWDPAAKHTPAGEANVGTISVDPATGDIVTVAPGLVPSLKDLVIGAGQIGCGYESSIEGWYRFLVDPDPYQSIAVENGRATPMGLDTVLLQQRKDFLRPSSLLAIIAISDENDCSIKEYGQFYYAAQQRDPTNPNKNFYLPKARSECATNPNDECCRSCGQDQSGCPADANCNGASLDAKTDDVNLRCWDQKRRFGIDFLYPIDRYVTGLTQPIVPNRQGEMVPNPIFSDLDPGDTDATVRDPSLVLLTYITGVPWQDIARRGSNGEPDLVAGLDLNGNPAGGFKDAAELAIPDAMGHPAWDYVIGDPANFVPPLDPLMIESTSPRMGQNPITGDPIAPTTAPPGTNPINGHEYTPNTDMGIQKWPDDLQYACIFDLLKPRDCQDTSLVSCDCHDPKNDNPLCEPDPTKPGAPRTLQVRAKAYPSIRQLSLVKALGTQGLVGSICPAQLTDISSPTYGYRPAIRGILDKLATQVEGGCLPKALPIGADGRSSCVILEGRSTKLPADTDACDKLCESLPGRIAVPKEHAPLREAMRNDPLSVPLQIDCACEIPQAAGNPSASCASVDSELGACQCDPSAAPVFNGKSVDGFCYLDAAAGQGSAAILDHCPADQAREIRFVGAGAPAPNTLVVLACTQ